MANKLNDVVPPGLKSSSSESVNKKSTQTYVERDQWGSKLDFILSCVGYAIGIQHLKFYKIKLFKKISKKSFKTF